MTVMMGVRTEIAGKHCLFEWGSDFLFSFAELRYKKITYLPSCLDERRDIIQCQHYREPTEQEH